MTIRFVACAGYTDRPTLDGTRMLRMPEDGLKPYGLFCPLGTLVGGHFQVGRIDHVGILGNEILLTGILFEDRHAGLSVAGLKDGTLRMNLDIDYTDYEPDTVTVEGPVVFTDWRVRAATVHSSPAWDLPPVMIWEAEGSC